MRHVTPYFPAALLVLVTIAAVFCLSGCQTLRDPSNTAIVELTTQVAVGKFIESKSDRAGTARHVVDVATQVKAIAESDSTTVGALQAVADARIAQLNLEPSDQLLATALVHMLVAELQGKIGDGLLNDTDKLILGRILGTVIVTANVYIPVNR
jgi:hypothetical protein